MSEHASAPSTAARILVVDDEPQIRRFLDISLRAQGYRVALAESAQAGLDRLATEGAELVILDLGLPDRDGQAVLADLRQWSQVPVIVLTVRGGEAEKVAALDAGANDYVTKPFGVQELMARVRSLLRTQADVEEPADLRLVVDHQDPRRRRWRGSVLTHRRCPSAVPAAAG